MAVYLSHILRDCEMVDLLGRYPVGLEAIEFGIGDSLDREEETLRSFRSRMGAAIRGIPLSLHGPFLDLSPASCDSLMRRATMQRFSQAYRVAQRLHAKHLVFHTGYLPDIYFEESWVEKSVDFWKEFLSDKDASVAVHLENVFDPDFEPIARVIDAVAHPAFSACLDVGHAHWRSGCVDRWLDGLGERIGHVHLHNNDRTRDQHFGLLRGTIDMERVLRRLSREFPHAGWTLEINGKEELENSLKWLGEKDYL